MQFMIIEKFHPGKIKTLYQRFEEKGRLLPDGAHYLNSWIDEKVATCYQLMESDSIEKIEEWVEQWKDLADFEIVPVIGSEEAKRRVFEK